jgi:hypothetical protein
VCAVSNVSKLTKIYLLSSDTSSELFSRFEASVNVHCYFSLDSCGESAEEDDDYEDDSWEYYSDDGAEDEEGWEYYFYDDTDTGESCQI